MRPITIITGDPHNCERMLHDRWIEDLKKRARIWVINPNCRTTLNQTILKVADREQTANVLSELHQEVRSRIDYPDGEVDTYFIHLLVGGIPLWNPKDLDRLLAVLEEASQLPEWCNLAISIAVGNDEAFLNRLRNIKNTSLEEVKVLEFNVWTQSAGTSRLACSLAR